MGTGANDDLKAAMGATADETEATRATYPKPAEEPFADQPSGLAAQARSRDSQLRWAQMLQQDAGSGDFYAGGTAADNPKKKRK
jgi:hypothetical protein